MLSIYVVVSQLVYYCRRNGYGHMIKVHFRLHNNRCFDFITLSSERKLGCLKIQSRLLLQALLFRHYII